MYKVLKKCKIALKLALFLRWLVKTIKYLKTLFTGNIIGSGIFIAPATILRFTESAGLSLIIWVLCALIAFLGKFYVFVIKASFWNIRQMI